MNILLIEADEECEGLTRALLTESTELPAALTVAEGLSEGGERLRGSREPYDAVVVVLSGPDAGEEVLRFVAAFGAKYPIIVVSEGSGGDLARRAIVAGAQDLLEDGELSGPRLVRALEGAVQRQRRLLKAGNGAFRPDDAGDGTDPSWKKALAILESLGGAFLVLRPGSYEIVTASGDYLEATMRTLPEIKGLTVFEAFPDDPDDPLADGVRNLRRSLEWVERALEPHTMAVQHYPMARPESEGGGFEERYWSPVNTPVLSDDGDLLFILHRVEDVTEYVRKRYGSLRGEEQVVIPTDVERKEADLVLRAKEIQRLNERLAASEGNLRRIFEGVAAGITVLDERGAFIHANPSFCAMVDRTLDELRDTDFLSITHPDDREANMEMVAEILAGDREAFVMEKRYLSGEGHLIWARVSVSRLASGEGGHRLITVSEDITAERRAEERIQESERALEMAGRAARVGGWIVDLDPPTIHWSEMVYDIHEVPQGKTIELDEAIDYYAPRWRPVIREAFQRCAEEGEPWDLELQLDTATGRRIWVRAIGEAVRDAKGVIRRVQGAFQDLTREKETEEELVRSRAAFYELAEAMPVIVWGADGDGTIDYATSMLVEYCGRPLEEILGDRWLDLLHPDDRDDAEERWSTSVETLAPYRTEFRIRRRDGEHRWHRLEAVPVLASDGSVERWYGSATDIHELRSLEKEARDLAERLVTTLDSLNDMFFSMDREWRFTFANRSLEEMVGRSRDELLGVKILDAFPDARGTAFHQAYQRAFEEDVAVSVQAYYEPLDVWVDVRAYPTKDGLAVFGRDISERVEAERQIRYSEARFRSVARATSDVIWDWDLENDAAWWSSGLLETFGIDPAHMEPGAEGWTKRIHPDDLERVEKSIFGTINSDIDEWASEYRFQRANGEYAQVEDRGFVIRDEDGRAVRMVGGMSDATERLEHVSRLREQAELLDRVQDAIFVLDAENRIVFGNRRVESIYGWTVDEVQGRSARDLLFVDPEEYDEALRQVLRRGVWSGEVTHRQKVGTLTVESRWSLVRDAEDEPHRILVVNTDITERIKLQQQFLRAQRMESIGTLAGGIAHDLNNVLAPILLSVGMLREDETDPEVQETLETVESAARRGAEMVKQVLMFARGVEGAQVGVSVGAVMSDLRRVTRDIFPKNVSILESMPDDLWGIRGDPTQIHQVLLNLLVNARDAMPDGGVVRVEGENTAIDENYAAMHPQAEEGAYVQISVTDNGTGMPQEVVDRIFDPFYTTKEVGKGTGLGLSTVAAIMRSHRGFVNVYSEPGSGTTFRLYFPAEVSDVDEGLAGTVSERNPVLPRGNGELVLVVDDESSIREITRQTLEAFGYRVVTATDGADAVATYGRLGSEIGVVLTDIMMPIMDGPATIRALRRMNPAVRIIAASGLGENGGVARAADAGVAHFLPKPYTADTLLAKLHEVLSETPT